MLGPMSGQVRKVLLRLVIPLSIMIKGVILYLFLVDTCPALTANDAFLHVEACDGGTTIIGGRSP